MRMFTLNMFLATVWMFLQGDLRVSNFVVGFVLSYAVIALNQQALRSRSYSRKVIQVAGFVAFVAWEIFTASLALAWMIIHPRLPLRPAVVAVPLDAQTDLEIVVLANLLSLSPGTLSLDVSADRKTLYVHSISLRDPDAFRREIKQRLERRELEVMR